MTFQEKRIEFRMVKKSISCPALALIIFLLSCAHKGPPLRIDRIDPKIVNIVPINERQIMLNFSEELDTLSIETGNFVIHSDQETLGVLAATKGNNANQILLVTAKMNITEYKIDGKVSDKSGRVGIFRSNFRGSARPDTIAPWLISYSKGIRLYEFFLEFSEPVDTSSFRYLVLPRRRTDTKWQSLKRVYVIPSSNLDSLHFDTTYYLYVKEVKDLSGNLSPKHVTTITPDSLYNPLFIKGKAMLSDSIITDGIAVLERDNLLGLSLIRHGEFLFEVRDSSRYWVRIFSQGYYGAESLSISEVGRTIFLNLGAPDLDSIIN